MLSKRHRIMTCFHLIGHIFICQMTPSIGIESSSLTRTMFDLAVFFLYENNVIQQLRY